LVFVVEKERQLSFLHVLTKDGLHGHDRSKLQLRRDGLSERLADRLQGDSIVDVGEEALE
jgi:hypothetical protein